jgi:sulfur carrier protein
MIDASVLGITLNGLPHACEEGETVAILVGNITGHQITASGGTSDGNRIGIAVARNSNIVPRSHWSTTPLISGDRIEILTAAQGG